MWALAIGWLLEASREKGLKYKQRGFEIKGFFVSGPQWSRFRSSRSALGLLGKGVHSISLEKEDDITPFPVLSSRQILSSLGAPTQP